MGLRPLCPPSLPYSANVKLTARLSALAVRKTKSSFDNKDAEHYYPSYPVPRALTMTMIAVKVIFLAEYIPSQCFDF